MEPFHYEQYRGGNIGGFALVGPLSWQLPAFSVVWMESGIALQSGEPLSTLQAGPTLAAHQAAACRADAYRSHDDEWCRSSTSAWQAASS